MEGVRYSDGSVASGIWLTIRTAAGVEGPYQALDLWWYVVVAADARVLWCVGCALRGHARWLSE